MSERLSAQDVTDLRIAWAGGSKLVIATVERILAAHLADVEAEVAALRETLEAGKASGIIAAMWHEAVARGHSPISAKHALTFFVERADELANAEARLAAAEACADSMQHFADVAEVCERKSNDYAERLTKVEALAESWRRGLEIDEAHPMEPVSRLLSDLRAALRPDPSEARDG